MKIDRLEKLKKRRWPRKWPIFNRCKDRGVPSARGPLNLLLYSVSVTPSVTLACIEVKKNILRFWSRRSRKVTKRRSERIFRPFKAPFPSYSSLSTKLSKSYNSETKKDWSFSRPPCFLQLFETSIFDFEGTFDFPNRFWDTAILKLKTAVSQKRLGKSKVPSKSKMLVSKSWRKEGGLENDQSFFVSEIGGSPPPW